MKQLDKDAKVERGPLYPEGSTHTMDEATQKINDMVEDYYKRVADEHYTEKNWEDLTFDEQNEALAKAKRDISKEEAIRYHGVDLNDEGVQAYLKGPELPEDVATVVDQYYTSYATELAEEDGLDLAALNPGRRLLYIQKAKDILPKDDILDYIDMRLGEDAVAAYMNPSEFVSEPVNGTWFQITPKMREEYNRIKNAHGAVFPAYKKGGYVMPNNTDALKIANKVR
jgi:hypothetical protein